MKIHDQYVCCCNDLNIKSCRLSVADSSACWSYLSTFTTSNYVHLSLSSSRIQNKKKIIENKNRLTQRKQTCDGLVTQSCQLLQPMGGLRALLSWNNPLGILEWVAFSLLQDIFLLTPRESNLVLAHGRFF